MPNSATPVVSVITRTRDRPRFLRRALESVNAQTETSWEHIIVNDRGDPEVVERALKAAKGPKRIVVNLEEGQGGMQAGLNAALAVAQGRYVAIHDDDDSWEPQFLQTTTEWLEAAGPDSRFQGVITQTIRIWEEEGKDGKFQETQREPYVPIETVGLLRAGFENPFPPIAFLYRRSVHDSVGLYREEFGPVGDLEFNVRFLQQFDIQVILEPLALYHWRIGSEDPRAANSFTSRKQEHDQRVNELRNAWLRSKDPADRILGLGLNLARQSFESEWLSWYLKDKIDALVPRVERIEDNSERLAKDVRAEQTLQRVEAIQKLIEGDSGLLRHYENFNKVQTENRKHFESIYHSIESQLRRLADVTERQNVLGESLKALALSQEPARHGLEAIEANATKLGEDLSRLEERMESALADMQEQIGRLTPKKRPRRVTRPATKESPSKTA